MRLLRRSLIGLFLVSATFALLAMAGFVMVSAFQTRMAAPDRPRMAEERVFTVNVLTARSETIAPVLTTFGEVRSRRTLELRAPVAGRIIELAEGFEDGARVEAGQLLIRIDPADAQAAVDIARSELARAEAELREADAALDLAADDLAAAVEQARLRVTALERQRNLQDRGVGTDAAVETAALAVSTADQAVLSRRSALAQAEARLDQAENALGRQRIALTEAERRLRDTEIHAGFSGILGDTTAVAGGLVSTNERLASIIDPTELEVSFRLSTSQYARLLDGQGGLIPAEMRIVLDVMGAEIVAPGRLSRVAAAVGEGQTGRLLYARLEEARGFRPGDFVTVEVEEPALDGVALIPASAVDGAGTVLVLGADDRLESVAVEVLRRQGNDVILRAAALEGREVVVERAPMLGAGIRVRPLRADGAEQEDAAEMIQLTPERRAALIAHVQANARMPQEARERMLATLEQDLVPAGMIARLEARAGG